MAKLRSHGLELFRDEGLTDKIALFADGHILRDYGSGWKLYKKLKPGQSATDYAETLRERLRTLRGPSWHAFAERFHALVSFKNRHFVYNAIKLLPDDPDGVYSEMDDSFMGREIGLSIEECVELCILFRAAAAEKAEKPTPIAE